MVAHEVMQGEGDFIGIGRAERPVKAVKVVTFPGDAVLSHPFAPHDGLKRFAEAAARLDG